MTEANIAVVLARAEERLRQERELFDQKKAQDRKMFVLKLTMGWTAVALLVAICAFAGYIILNNHDFNGATVATASSALLVEALGLAGAIWRGTFGRTPSNSSRQRRYRASCRSASRCGLCRCVANDGERGSNERRCGARHASVSESIADPGFAAGAKAVVARCRGYGRVPAKAVARSQHDGHAALVERRRRGVPAAIYACRS